MGISAGEPPAKAQKTHFTNSLAASVRDVGRGERDWEESRLRKRNGRKEGQGEQGAGGSRAGSAAPATPGSVAPEPEKPPTKKELKKSAKAAEASHASQNQTSSLFTGSGPRNLFGKKKGGKSYSWMTAGGGGSGASTPARPGTPGLGKAAGGATGSPGPANLALTADGRNRLGTWREDKERGRNIQLRDWVVVLERDGSEPLALQSAYDRLDASGPK